MAKAAKPVTAKVSSKMPNKRVWNKVVTYSFGQSRSYLFEYGLLLLLVGALVSLLTMMIDSIVGYLHKTPQTLTAFGELGYPISIILVSALIVILPLLIILLRRTRESEYQNPKIKNIGWRKAFLGIFLATISITAIITLVSFVYEIVSYVSRIGIGGNNKFAWQSALSSFLAVIVLGSTAWLFGQDYRSVPSRYTSWQRMYRYGIVGVSLLIAALFVTIPMREQRGAYVDSLVVNDLRDIRLKVNQAQTEDGKLPKSLNDLKLTKEQEQNAVDYSYDYNPSKSKNKFELCAHFRTDTREQEQSNPTVMPLSSSLLGAPATSDMYPSQEDNDPARHSDGQQCFTYASNFGNNRFEGGLESPGGLPPNLNLPSFDDQQQPTFQY